MWGKGVNSGCSNLKKWHRTSSFMATHTSLTRNDVEEVLEVLLAEIEAPKAILVHPGTAPLLGQVQRRHGVSLQATKDRGEHHNQHCQRLQEKQSSQGVNEFTHYAHPRGF